MPSNDSDVLKVALEAHFAEVDGAVYTDIAFDYNYWKEYLSCFGRVEPVARVARLPQAPEGWRRADGPGVVFRPVVDYRGFWSFLRNWRRAWRDCRRATAGPSPALLRLGNVSAMCWLSLALRGRPYAFEAVGHAGLGARTVKSVRFLGLGRLIGAMQHWLTKVIAARAACASYVSQYVRGLYPTRSGREWVFSSVRLKDEAFCPPREESRFRRRPLRIISVGRLEPEKGHDVLINAAAELRRRGVNGFTVDIVGPGSQVENLRRLCRERGVCQFVRVVGMVPPGKALHQALDDCDLFVMPSLTEGLGRALVEALARGLPAVGSATGGIIELLPSECTVQPGNAAALADKLSQLLADPKRLAELSAQSVATARSHRYDLMQQRKHEFWRCIRTTFGEA